MQLAYETRRAGLSLLALQFATALAGIWLLGRGAPAVERILAENVETLRTVREMQRGLVELGDPLPSDGAIDAGRKRFEQAYERAVENVSEAEEVPVLAEIDAQFSASFNAAETRTAAPSPALLDALDELASINRDSMERARARAQRLSTAGAWSLAGLAIATVLLSLRLLSRAGDRLLAPIDHLREVSLACQRGDTHRRCETIGMPEELAEVAKTINRLLDSQLRHRDRPRSDTPAKEAARGGQVLDEHAMTMVGAFLEYVPGAVAIFDRDGHPIASSRAGAHRLREARAALLVATDDVLDASASTEPVVEETPSPEAGPAQATAPGVASSSFDILPIDQWLLVRQHLE